MLYVSIIEDEQSRGERPRIATFDSQERWKPFDQKVLFKDNKPYRLSVHLDRARESLDIGQALISQIILRGLPGESDGGIVQIYKYGVLESEEIQLPTRDGKTRLDYDLYKIRVRNSREHPFVNTGFGLRIAVTK